MHWNKGAFQTNTYQSKPFYNLVKRLGQISSVTFAKKVTLVTLKKVVVYSVALRYAVLEKFFGFD